MSRRMTLGDLMKLPEEIAYELEFRSRMRTMETAQHIVDKVLGSSNEPKKTIKMTQSVDEILRRGDDE